MYTKEVIMAEITKDELNEINGLRDKLATVVSDTGQFQLQVEMLELDVAELKSKIGEQAKLFKSLLVEEQDLINRLSEKYGVGSINFETGEFTPER
jgi:ribosomal protein L9